MALRNILKQGDPTLNKTSRPVTDFNERLHTLLDDMRETLEESGGVGLAAPQVGILRRAVLVLETNHPDDEEDTLIELINPVIIAKGGEQVGPEGCLSIPGEYGLVKRPFMVKVRAQDRYGKEFEVLGTKLTARAFVHEIDHLDGHLYTEFVEKMLTQEELEEYYADEEEEDEE
ncbi:MAG: peptide deformylase [Oscillospiraceae bacterium]|nr:peptide deformylase [Oscillospiraceae bacterium]